MPNQLSETKKRKTVAEHAAVLAALDAIAAMESTTSTELLREAARSIIRDRAQDAQVAQQLRIIAEPFAPSTHATHLKTPAKMARFKRQQREFDSLLLDLDLTTADQIQSKNSIHVQRRKPRLVEGL